jgi:serine/threonine protein kinase
VDIRADLYSLGCTFFYLLTGRPPFQAQNLNELLLKHHTDELPPLDSFRNDVPPLVQDIIRKLLAKRPEDRFQTPAELAAALPVVRKKIVANDAPPPVARPTLDITIGPTPIISPTPRPARRKRVVVALACLGVLLAGLGLALAVSSSGARDHATGTVQISSPATTTFPAHTRPETRSERNPTRPAETRPDPTIARADPTGTWKWSMPFGGQARDSILKLRLEGGRLTGSVMWRDGQEHPLENVSYRDGEVSFKVTRERKGQKFTMAYHGTVTEDTIKGKMELDFGGERTRDWEARRVKE